MARVFDRSGCLPVRGEWSGPERWKAEREEGALLHDSHWERLISLVPDDVCRRAGVQHDPATGCYLVPLLNRRVRVDPSARSVAWDEDPGADERPPGFTVALVSVVYLVGAKEIHPSGEWVTGESLPAGTFFFRGPHAMPTEELARRYGKDPEGLLVAGARLGGTAGDMGDACVELWGLPRVPLRVVLWEGDEEFPSRVTILVDRTADSQLALDALLSLAQYVASALVQEGGRAAEGTSS